MRPWGPREIPLASQGSFPIGSQGGYPCDPMGPGRRSPGPLVPKGSSGQKAPVPFGPKATLGRFVGLTTSYISQ